MSQQINLVSPRLLKKRYAFVLREMAIGLGVLLLGAFAWAGFQHHQASEMDTRATQQEALQADAQQQLDELKAAAGRPTSALLLDRVKVTQAQVAQREALLNAIDGTLTSTASGFSTRLRALAYGSTPGVWLNAFTLTPHYVELKGSALNADLLTGYMDQLGKQPAFAGMPFSGMNAALIQPAADNTVKTEAVVDHVDFDLHSGSPDAPAASGGSHGP
jgi:hypothetical protein